MKERILFFLILLAIIALVPLMYYVLFERGWSVPIQDTKQLLLEVPANPVDGNPVDGGVSTDGGPAQKFPPIRVSLVRVEGVVEHSRQGSDWTVASEGMLVMPGDWIRTRYRSRASLVMPGKFSVDLQDLSECRLLTSEDTFRFNLVRGMMTANLYQKAGQGVEVVSAQGVIRGRAGRFRMYIDPEATVSLGVLDGEIEIESGNESLSVGAGFMTRWKPGKTIPRPTHLPKMLPLVVTWPERQDRLEPQLIVHGRTRPDVRVIVAGQIAKVDAQGRFRETLVVTSGDSRFDLSASDVGGHVEERSSPDYRQDPIDQSGQRR